MSTTQAYPVTPDGRYFVVRGRLWRCSDPGIPDGERQALVSELMSARRAVHAARAQGEAELAAARARVDRAKRRLGERGAVWWRDGQPDLNRQLVASTPYAAWYARIRHEGSLCDSQRPQRGEA